MGPRYWFHGEVPGRWWRRDSRPESGEAPVPGIGRAAGEPCEPATDPGAPRGHGAEPANGHPAGQRNGHPAGTATAWDLPQAGQGDGDAQVPAWLQRAAGWAWRLLLLGVVIYLGFRVAGTLRVVVLPCVAALLLTALLQPLLHRLRRAGLPSLAATWCTLLIAVAVLAGAGTLATTQTTADYPTLAREIGQTVRSLQHWLAGPPLHLRQGGLEQLSGKLLAYLQSHQAVVFGTVLNGSKIFLELLAGLVLALFVTFFLLKDGGRIWAWLTGFLAPEARRRAQGAGEAAWTALVYYVRGTVAVAAIHAVVIGLTLWVMGVPLLVPLVILVFLAAFVPLVGILVAGALAVLVTLGTRGWLAAVVLIAVFVLENQLESHLLQPLVVGHMLRLHPLAIILALAVGGVLYGIPGAVVAVPAAAALTRAAPYLAGRRATGPPGAADLAGEPALRR
jgi:predicted PurR-regulated permease PerM